MISGLTCIEENAEDGKKKTRIILWIRTHEKKIKASRKMTRGQTLLLLSDFKTRNFFVLEIPKIKNHYILT